MRWIGSDEKGLDKLFDNSSLNADLNIEIFKILFEK